MRSTTKKRTRLRRRSPGWTLACRFCYTADGRQSAPSTTHWISTKYFPRYINAAASIQDTPLPWNTPDGEGGRRKRRPGRKLQVYVEVGCLGQLGATACVVFLDTNIVHRGLHIHGAIISAEQPVYLDEVSILHALRTLHDWLYSTGQLQEELHSITVRAGSGLCGLSKTGLRAVPSNSNRRQPRRWRRTLPDWKVG